MCGINLIHVNNETLVLFSGFSTVWLFWFTMEGIADDDKKGIDIKLKLCCEICHTPTISIKPEASNSTSNNTEYIKLHDGSDDKSTIKLSRDQRQTTNDKVQLKQEVDSDSDTEVDLAYRIIDNFHAGNVKTIKRESENVLPNDEISLTRGFQNYHNNSSEVNNKADIEKDLDYEIQSKGML